MMSRSSIHSSEMCPYLRLIKMEPYHGMTTRQVAESLNIQAEDQSAALHSPLVLELRQRLYTKV